MEFNKTWYSVNEVSKILLLSEQSINRYIRMKEITNIKTIGKKNFINKEVIVEFQEKIERVKEYYTTKEVAKKLNKTPKAITNMVYRNRFKTAINLFGKGYISKKEIDKMSSCFNNTLQIYEIADKYNLARADVAYLAENNLVEAQNRNSIWYINIDSLERTLKHIIKSFYLKSFDEITRKHLDAFQQGVDGISADEVSKILNISKQTIRRYIREGIICAAQVGGIYYIKKSEIDKFFNTVEGIKMRNYDTKNILAMVNEIMDYMIQENIKCKETLKAFKIWINQKLNKSKGSDNTKRMHATKYINTAQVIADSLREDIWNCEESELQQLSKSTNTQNVQKCISSFYSYIKSFKKCKCTTIFMIKAINHENSESSRSKKEVYTKKEWIQIKNYLTNISFHIDKAKENRKYAQSWLFAILHLSLSWRRADFFDIPALPVEELMECEIEKLDLYNISYAEAQKVINMMKNRCIPIIANKNGVLAHIVITTTILKSTVAAICVNELHRTKTDDKKMFYYKNITNSDVNKILPEKYPKFASRMANKTKMTYSFETASDNRGRSELAYQLQTYSRSHKIKVNGFVNEVTAAYLNVTNTNIDTNLIAKNLFERGAFGWQIELMLQVANVGENDKITDRTRRIKALSKEMSPIVIEGMASYLNNVEAQASELLDELMTLGSEEILRRLHLISKMQSPALLKDTECIKGASNCPYPEGKENCLGCKYNIPTNHVLETINIRLCDALSALENTSDSNIIDRIKYTHIIRKLLYILMDFRKYSKKLGDDYLPTFIDLELIRKRIIILEDSKFLEVGVENNGY